MFDSHGIKNTGPILDTCIKRLCGLSASFMKLSNLPPTLFLFRLAPYEQLQGRTAEHEDRGGPVRLISEPASLHNHHSHGGFQFGPRRPTADAGYTPFTHMHIRVRLHANQGSESQGRK